MSARVCSKGPPRRVTYLQECRDGNQVRQPWHFVAAAVVPGNKHQRGGDKELSRLRSLWQHERRLSLWRFFLVIEFWQ
jgi:hypothetical protein